VARAKGEIFDGLRAGGTAVINADDPSAELWRGMNAGRRILASASISRPRCAPRVEAKALGSSTWRCVRRRAR
jgi:UDP-N-acetylmuramoyl-tripeptide--D-alanyl-D-alanine ligase